MLYILASLFCLFFTATSYCNVIWPVAMTNTALLGCDVATCAYLTSLLSFIFIPLEAYLYYRYLKGISYLRALGYAIVANITTLLTIRIGMILINVDITAIDANPSGAYFIFFLILTALTELIVLKLVTGCTFKKIIVPVSVGYVATIAIRILAQLISALQK